jgi:hypothetical protein
MQNDFEAVHTVADYSDSPRSGIADFRGRPHAYRSLWDNSEDDRSGAFLLQPIDDETFRLAMEIGTFGFVGGAPLIAARLRLRLTQRYQPIVTLSRRERFECEDDLPCERRRSVVAVPPDSGLSVG